MNKKTFAVKKRDVKIKPNKIREQGSIPGNLYGPEIESQAVLFNASDFHQIYAEVGESGLIYIQIDKKETPAMIEEVQVDPVTMEPIHASFKAIDLKEKTRTEIPIEFVGEFDLAEAVLVRVRDEVEVEALPTDLPEKFEVNLSNLTEIGQSITLGDLDYNREKVEIIVADEGMEAPIVLVQEMEEEEEEEEPIETEIIGEEEVEGEEGETQETGGEVAQDEIGGEEVGEDV